MSQGGPPVSFKTNVNRMKTKRWAEAKSANYDGDDWGDEYDDYEGYDEPEPEPVPQKPTGLRHIGQAAAPAPRQASLSGGGLLGGPQAAAAPPQAPYARPAHERQPSYERGAEYLGRPPADPSPRSRSPVVSPIRTAYSQAQSLEQPPPQPQSRGHTPSSSRGPFLGQTEGSRTHSMSSNTSQNRATPPLAQPQPPFAQGSAPRKSSLGQQSAPTHFPAAEARPSSSGSNSAAMGGPRDRADSGTKALPFIRPADIYKRMQEEKEKQRQSQESSRPSLDAVSLEKSKSRDASPGKSGDESDPSRRGQKSTLLTVAERKTEYAMEGGLLSPSKVEALQETRATSGSPQLPDIGGLGGDFGMDWGSSFMGSQSEPAKAAAQAPKPVPVPPRSEPAALQPEPTPPKQQPVIQQPQPTRPVQQKEPEALKHAPSQGYRSAVHQAFDQPAVPESPSSGAGSSFGRSNSESTNAISPIISRGPSDAQPSQKNIDTVTNQPQFPPITEEPITPTQGVTRGRTDTVEDEKPPGFVPGHRRDMSTPSPDNSPARKPNLETSRGLRQPQEVQLANQPDTGSGDSSAGDENGPSVAKASQASVPKQPPQQKPPVTELASSAETTTAPTSAPKASSRIETPRKGPTSAPAVAQNAAALPASAGPHIPQDAGNDSELSREDDQFAKVEPLHSHPGATARTAAALETSTPQKLPDLSTASSPADQESDRLRKEIVRELSPQRDDTGQSWPDLSKAETSTSTYSGDASRQALGKTGTYASNYSTDETRKDSSTLVGEYANLFANDSYHDSAGAQPAKLETQRLAPIADKTEYTESPAAAEPSQPETAGFGTSHPQPLAQNASFQQGPPLARKFSWEAESESQTASQAEIQPPPLQTNVSGYHSSIMKDSPSSATDKQLPAHPPTSAAEMHRDPQTVATPSSALSGGLNGALPAALAAGSSTRTQAFREVMSVPDHDARMRSYKTTREQLVAQDHGMDSWLQSAEDIARVAQPPTMPESFARRPTMPMQQQQQQQPQQPQQGAGVPYQPSLPGPSTGASPGLTSSPSSAKLSSQQMQAKGKDLLHTAGVFSGKANVAAKGLLAKGRKKLRDAADREKVEN